jgi:hypothetical protein
MIHIRQRYLTKDINKDTTEKIRNNDNVVYHTGRHRRSVVYGTPLLSSHRLIKLCSRVSFTTLATILVIRGCSVDCALALQKHGAIITTAPAAGIEQYPGRLL